MKNAKNKKALSKIISILLVAALMISAVPTVTASPLPPCGACLEEECEWCSIPCDGCNEYDCIHCAIVVDPCCAFFTCEECSKCEECDECICVEECDDCGDDACQICNPFPEHTVQLMARYGTGSWTATNNPFASEPVTINKNGEYHTVKIENINQPNLVNLALMTEGANFCDEKHCNGEHDYCGFAGVEPAVPGFEDAVVIFESVIINGSFHALNRPYETWLIEYWGLPWADGHAEAELWNGWEPWLQVLDGVIRVNQGDGQTSFRLPGNVMIESIEVTFIVWGINGEWCSCGECEICLFELCCEECCGGFYGCDNPCLWCCLCDPCGWEDCCDCNGCEGCDWCICDCCWCNDCPGCEYCYDYCCFCCGLFNGDECGDPCDTLCCFCSDGCEGCCFCVDEPCGDCYVCNTCFGCYNPIDWCACCEDCFEFVCICECKSCGEQFCICKCTRCSKNPCVCPCIDCGQLPSKCSMLNISFNEAGNRIEFRAVKDIAAWEYFDIEAFIELSEGMSISKPKGMQLNADWQGGALLGGEFLVYVIDAEKKIPAGSVLFYLEVEGFGEISIIGDYYHKDKFVDFDVTVSNADSVKLGYVLGGDKIRIGDVLAVLKHLAGIETLTGSSLKAALVTQQSQTLGRPRINDVLEILKFLAGIDGVLKK